MPLHPDLPHRRTRAIAGDLALIALLALFGWLGLRVHDAIADLRSIGQGVTDAGTAIGDSGRQAGATVRSGFGSAADAVGGLPLVGGSLSGALRSSGSSAGAELERQAAAPAARVIEAGRRAQRETLRTARIVGWTIFLLPTILLLVRFLPARWGEVRDLSRARRVLGAHGDWEPERVRALAQRAAFSLPYADLVRHTPDPIGDLLAGRYEGLVAALGEQVGIRVGPQTIGNGRGTRARPQ